MFLVLLGFCFGVWAGNQKSKPVEVAKAPSQAADNSEPKPAERPDSKPVDKPEAKRTEGPASQPSTPPATQPPAVTMPEETPPPKKEPPKAVVTSETKKPTEVKPTPEPKKPPMVAKVSFEKEILPLFRSKCLNCHGGVGNPKGGLDLRTVAAIMKGGDSGPGVKPNDLEKSPVWTSVDEGSMPPSGKDPLTDAEKMLVRNWILSGAK